MIALTACQHCLTPLGRSFLASSWSPLCQSCTKDLQVGAELALPLRIPAAWRLIEPSYAILKTWKKHPGHSWHPLLLPAVRRLCSEDIRIKEFAPQWICPVPQAPPRLGHRLVAPTQQAAEIFGEALQIPVLRGLSIVGEQRTPLRQAERDGWSRRHAAMPWLVVQTRVPVKGRGLLVDDFATTGRTLRHCEQILSQREGVSVLSAALGSRLAAAAACSSEATTTLQP